MKRFIILFTLFFIPFLCNSEGWKHITTLPYNNWGGVERQTCIAPDYCLSYNLTNIMYRSTDQGKNWDSVYKFNDRYFETFNSSLDCQYYFMHRNDFIHIPGAKKVFLKTNENYKKFEVINYIDTSSYIDNIGSPFMFDTNNGFLSCYEIINDNEPWWENLNKFFIVTHNGWKTYVRRDIPLYFWSSGYEYMKVNDDNVLCYSGGYNLNVKDKDTIIRGGIIANYNFKKDEWTLVYKFPEPPKDFDPMRSIFAFGPHNLQKMNDSVCYGMSSRQMGYYPDSNTKFYDVFYRTRDGNKSWQKTMDTLRVDVPYDLQDMRFYDENNGLIVGRNGKVLMTNDGGNTWFLEDPKQFSKPSIQVVFFVDWAGQFPIIGTRLDGEIFRYEGNFFKFDFKSPLLFFPKKDAVGQERNLLFRWEELRDATNYHFQLSTDAGFNNILQESSAKQMQFPYNNLEPFTAYWWRVSSSNGKDTLWSEPHYFRTKMPEISIVLPNCNAIDQPDSTVISWSAVKGAEKYRIRLSENATFDTIIFEFENITSTEFKLNKLEYLKKYYWQVQAYRSDESGEWSEVCSFTVEDNPASVSDDNSFRIIYPNPAGNFITLSESDTKLYTDYEIYDISGRLLQKSVLSSFRIDISTLERGSYYLRLLSPSGIATAGFLKME